MLKMLLLVVALLVPQQMVAQPFPYSANPHPNAGNAIAYQYPQVRNDGYGNHFLETFVFPRMNQISGQPVGEGIFHVYTFLDMNITFDPLPGEPLGNLVWGSLDEHLFSPHSIQLTANYITTPNILTPAGWALYYPCAEIAPYPQLSPDFSSCSFHFSPIAYVGLPQVMTSSTHVPPLYHGLWIYVTIHTVVNFESEYYGSGWAVESSNWWLSL